MPARIEGKNKLSVAFVLSPNFTMLAFSAFIDTLRLAGDDGDRSRPIYCEWTVLSHNMQPIKASCGIAVCPTSQMDDPTKYDYIVVVGGLLSGARLAPLLCDYLKQAAASGIPLVGVCTGSFILARLGLMKERCCCVSWFHHEAFINEFPDLAASSDELFIDNTDRLTCAGGTSVVHLAAYLVARHCNKARAEKALRIMLEDMPLPSKTPQPQPLFAKKSDDIRVRKAMLLIERNLATPLSTEDVARHVKVSVRHLERLFLKEIGMSPTAFAFEFRLDYAYNLLIRTQYSILEIALECGFPSNSHFSRCFRKVYGTSASQVRQANKAVAQKAVR